MEEPFLLTPPFPGVLVLKKRKRVFPGFSGEGLDFVVPLLCSEVGPFSFLPAAKPSGRRTVRVVVVGGGQRGGASSII